MDGDTLIITTIHTTAIAVTHIMVRTTTMVLTMVLQDAQTTTMVIEQAWGQKLAQLIQIEALQLEQKGQ